MKAKRLGAALAAVAASLIAGPALAGAVFVSGHDPIWHTSFGPNHPGAVNLAGTAIDFARDGSTLPFLFVESISVPVPEGNAHEAPFLASKLGFVPGTDFDVFDRAALDALVDFRTTLTSYSAIVVASDHGGMLTAAELEFLNAHSADIIDYLNAGGGLAAFAESNDRGLIGTTPPFQFLPFLVTSTRFSVPELENRVTPFGESLGLRDSDVNGNFSHNFFVETGGMHLVDLFEGDPERPLSLAFRGTITPGGVPEPTMLILVATSLGALVLSRRR